MQLLMYCYDMKYMQYYDVDCMTTKLIQILQCGYLMPIRSWVFADRIHENFFDNHKLLATTARSRTHTHK